MMSCKANFWILDYLGYWTLICRLSIVFYSCHVSHIKELVKLWDVEALLMDQCTIVFSLHDEWHKRASYWISLKKQSVFFVQAEVLRIDSWNQSFEVKHWTSSFYSIHFDGPCFDIQILCSFMYDMNSKTRWIIVIFAMDDFCNG